MQKVGRHVGPIPMYMRQCYVCMVAQCTNARKPLWWSFLVWVHRVVSHSGAHLQRWCLLLCTLFLAWDTHGKIEGEGGLMTMVATFNGAKTPYTPSMRPYAAKYTARIFL